jgi:hypothetical protein
VDDVEDIEMNGNVDASDVVARSELVDFGGFLWRVSPA